LKWKNVGTDQPTAGKVIVAPNLADALKQKWQGASEAPKLCSLLLEEWKAVAVAGLRYDNLIEVEGSYFQPDGVRMDSFPAPISSMLGVCVTVKLGLIGQNRPTNVSV